MAGTRERQLSLRWLVHIQIVAIVELCGRNEIRKAFYSFPLKARFVSHRVASSLGGEMKPRGRLLVWKSNYISQTFSVTPTRLR